MTDYNRDDLFTAPILRPSLDELREAARAVVVARIEFDMMRGRLARATGNELEFCRVQLVKCAEAYRAAGNAQTDLNLRRACKELLHAFDLFSSDDQSSFVLDEEKAMREREKETP